MESYLKSELGPSSPGEVGKPGAGGEPKGDGAQSGAGEEGEMLKDSPTGEAGGRNVLIKLVADGEPARVRL